MSSIIYRYNDGLYLNITNKCTNACVFCIRTGYEKVGDSESLWLEKEPEKEVVFSEIEKKLTENYSEIVFCGYGEPLMRLNDVLWLCDRIKENYRIPIRINTNGQADLIHKKETAPLLKGRVDSVSVSLNAPTKERYNEICMPDDKEKAFYSMLYFTCECKKYVKNVCFSVVEDILKEREIEKCKEIAESMNLSLKIRKKV